MENNPTLVELIRDSELVIRTKMLQRVIDNNPVYIEQFHRLLALQKKIVQADQSGNRQSAATAREAYREGMANLSGNPAVAEYLLCCEELNELVQEVKEILQNGMQKPEKG